MINKYEVDLSLLIKAINQTGVGVVISNPRLEKNPLIYVNKGFEELTGYCADEIIGHNCRFLQGDKTKQSGIQIIAEAIREQKQCEVEILNYRKNGEAFWNELQITPLFDEQGQIEYFIGIQKDITRKKQEHDARMLFEKVFQNTLQGVMITDKYANILLVNAAFTEITGYTLDEALGRNPNMLSSGKQDETFYDNLWNEIKLKGHWEGEIWNKRKNGEIYPEYLNINEVKDDNGEIINYVAIFNDITHSKNREKQLAKLMMQDALTGIANRRKFDNYLLEKWLMFTDIHEPISLIFIDIDFFKLYNDHYGHPEGDRCLIQIAKVIDESVNHEVSLAARYGGEEFAVILPQYDATDALQLAEKIRINVQKEAIPHSYSTISNMVSISCGVATLTPTKDLEMTELVQYADKALYEAKNTGRNKVMLFQYNCNQK